VLGLAILASAYGCEKTDPAAEALLRESVRNSSGLTTQGEMKVSFDVAGTAVTPWFRVSTGGGLPYPQLSPIKNRPLIDPGSVPPDGKIVRQTRGALSQGQAALTIDHILRITDVETFLAVHRVVRVDGNAARRAVAGRRVVHLTAAPRFNSPLHYEIFIDTEMRFILGIEERDGQGNLLHAVEYSSIRYLVSNAETAQPKGPAPARLEPLSPEEAARILGLDPARIFPRSAPAGFPRRELVKTGALETVNLRFSNGTSTGAIVVFLRKPAFQDVHYRPTSPSAALRQQRQIRQLVLSGQAFMEGQWVGLLYRADSFDCVEVHTPDKSILALTVAGDDVLKELIGLFPLP
jgi:hypothetical protein